MSEKNFETTSNGLSRRKFVRLAVGTAAAGGILGVGGMGLASTNGVKILVNGAAIDSSAAKIEGGRTLVPIRFVSEALGAKVSWEDATRTVTITGDVKSGATPNSPWPYVKLDPKQVGERAYKFYHDKMG
ncbi:MAG: copper amine oxidase N-terminal domain-containing protein [Bacillota bacterium]